MTIERPLQAILMLVLVAAAGVVIGRGLVYVTGGNTLIGSFTAEGERGGCPQTDNCVSSFAAEQPWAVAPIACAAPPAEALAITGAAIEATGNVEVVTAGRAYVVYSRVFRFPDDVRIEASARGVEIISSSRLGAGDLGTNRVRVEAVRELVETDPRC